MPPIPSTPVMARALGRREAVTDQIRFAIVNGTLLPGEVVREAELAAWLGVSVTPVREALSRLAGEGLVDMDANQPKRVAGLDREIALATIDVFQAIALSGISWAVGRLTEDDLVLMRAESAAFVDALTARDPDLAIVHLDHFWQVLFGSARNPELDSVLGSLRAKVLRVLRLYSPTTMYPAFVEDHRQNFRDIEQRDVAAVIARFGARFEFVRAAIDAAGDAPWEDPVRG
jgi:DNA-binding GntR family transcriptional regulator